MIGLSSLSKEEGDIGGRGERKCKKVPRWMDCSFLSPAARGETHCEHGSPRSEAPDGREPGDLLPVSGVRCAESHRDERACRLHSRSICAHGNALRHGSGRGVRASVTSIQRGLVQREALLLPGRGGGGSIESRNILYFSMFNVCNGSIQCTEKISLIIFFFFYLYRQLNSL